jgi:hypothetical protein
VDIGQPAVETRPRAQVVVVVRSDITHHKSPGWQAKGARRPELADRKRQSEGCAWQHQTNQGVHAGRKETRA